MSTGLFSYLSLSCGVQTGVIVIMSIKALSEIVPLSLQCLVLIHRDEDQICRVPRSLLAIVSEEAPARLI